MAHVVNFKKVKVNRSGACGGFTYVAGQPVELPETVLKALGEASFETVAGEDTKTIKPSYKELQDKAKELGLPINKKYDELAELIAENEAADAGNAE